MKDCLFLVASTPYQPGDVAHFDDMLADKWERRGMVKIVGDTKVSPVRTREDQLDDIPASRRRGARDDGGEASPSPQENSVVRQGLRR